MSETINRQPAHTGHATTYRNHKNRTVREIIRQSRFSNGCDMVLDNANDAWLDASGRVSERYAREHFIGDVSHLHGAARVSAALSIVSAYRASPSPHSEERP